VVFWPQCSDRRHRPGRPADPAPNFRASRRRDGMGSRIVRA